MGREGEVEALLRVDGRATAVGEMVMQRANSLKNDFQFAWRQEKLKLLGLKLALSNQNEEIEIDPTWITLKFFCRPLLRSAATGLRAQGESGPSTVHPRCCAESARDAAGYQERSMGGGDAGWEIYRAAHPIASVSMHEYVGWMGLSASLK